MYNSSNSIGAYGIQLLRVTTPTVTDSESFVDAGIPAINISTNSNQAVAVGCLNEKACDQSCGGNCATGKMCTAFDCQRFPCACDSYQSINFEKLASTSLLVRKSI